MSKLIIVESPAKAKTIKKYLGEDFDVVASMGHIRDLPKSKLGVDVDNDFAVIYENISGKEDLIKSLKSKAKKSEQVYLATDPDREGEAISWHLANLLGLDLAEKNRVTFNEITKSGVQGGMAAPRGIDLDLVNAQQARRVLDRLVGYKISPFLWKKVRKGLSAGRVQSVAVRLIVDREDEINAFKSEEYWSVDAMLKAEGEKKAFPAKLASKNGKKLNVKNKEIADAILEDLKKESFVVDTVKKGTRKKNPAPPFTTSTLQQEASRKLGFQARRTMKAAQELYEGIEVEGLGAVGLITYMRTDSLRLSAEALADAATYIKGKFGSKYLPSSPRVYKSKAAAQDAHEAIRPTMPELEPLQVKSSLSSDQYKLYKLIWERFIACQMAGALYDTVNADIKAGVYGFKASGFTVQFDGFTRLYEESKDEEEESVSALPALQEGAELKVDEIAGNQHFTQPPARFTEASLIKALEEKGIGRPSTYAPTITTIIQRGYVEREAKALKPTVLGDVTTRLMSEQFSNIVDAGFTAGMERNLDEIAEGKQNWVNTMSEFYTDFAETLKKAEENMEGKRVRIPDEATDEVCELCGKPMVIKMGRFGKFMACSGFPECKNTKKIVKDSGGICPTCGGKILTKRSKTGKTFYGCEKYPECTFATWDTPIEEKCPKCGATLFRTNGRGRKIHCLKENCGFEKPYSAKKVEAKDE
ncbi:MAG: type I DNA topoisomerase [Oscillospiraceae bacterium]|nr:type I DNA topoisomerase [Oscillospiraceae bacterium]